MYYVQGILMYDGSLNWQHQNRDWEDDKGVKVYFHFTSSNKEHQVGQCIRKVETRIKKNNITWIVPRREEWIFDLDKLKEFVPELSSMKWFKGKVAVRPEFEPEQKLWNNDWRYTANVVFSIYPETVEENEIFLDPPIEINESLKRFKKDYPSSKNVAFIMMRFGETNAHKEIVEGIKKSLKPFGIDAIRADNKQYHDDLFYNILTYLYGCGFGIAVFERIEKEDFNPNVSLEVGYMLALGKPVCLLKDKTLKILHTDLVGKLYKSFDPQNSLDTIPKEVKDWLVDKELI